MTCPFRRTRATAAAFPLTVTILCVLAALSATPLASAWSTSSAGPKDAVRGVTRSGDSVAGVIVWKPSPSALDVPPGTLGVAARALLDRVAAELGGGEPILRIDAHGLAVGVNLPTGEPSDLARWLRHLAEVADVGDREIAAAQRQRLGVVESLWAEPADVARLTARASASSAWRDAAWLAGRPRSLARVSAPDVRRALAALRRLPVEANVVGPPGTVTMLAERLGDRLGGGAPGAGPSAEPGAAQAAPRAVAVLAPTDASRPARVGLALVTVVGKEVVDEQGAALAVLLEAMSEGRGSLPQRLGVALGREVVPRVSWRAEPGGGALLGLSIEVSRDEADDGWRVLAGATRSVTEQPFLNAAAVNARKRLDRKAERFETAGAGEVLDASLDGRLGWWPPSDRWTRPIGPDQLLATAREVLVPERRFAAAAGPLPLELLRGEPLAGGVRIGSAGLCPERVDLTCPVEEPLAGLGDPGRQSEGRRRAEALMQRLRVADDSKARPGSFRAEYEVIERTPLGDVPMDLSVESSESGVAVQWRGEDWGLAAWTSEEGVEVRVDGEAPRESAVGGLDRIESFALREPVVLTDAVLDGLVPAKAIDLACGDERCPGLEAFMAEGSRIALVLDPDSLQPLEARLWWRGAGPPQPADEIYLFRSWTTAGPFRVVERVEARTNGAGGEREDRRYRLLSWSWTDEGG
jgi:hypothetical protein